MGYCIWGGEQVGELAMPRSTYGPRCPTLAGALRRKA